MIENPLCVFVLRERGVTRGLVSSLDWVGDLFNDYNVVRPDVWLTLVGDMTFVCGCIGSQDAYVVKMG
jgi:hypothetical protein